MDGGCTGANGTNPIATLRSRNASFATLHSTQKEYSTTPLRSGLVPLAPVGLYNGLDSARPKRKVLAEFGQCISVLRSSDPILANFPIGERVPKGTEPLQGLKA